MRVTKSVKKFITEEVSLRIDHKYTADREEACRQKKAFHEFVTGYSMAAADAFNAYFEEHWGEVSDFAFDHRNHACAIKFEFCDWATELKDGFNTVHAWRYRKEKEVEKIVEEITLQLELGGGKAELMKMLDEIGKKED